MKSNNPLLVSIIVPIYNVEKYLDECIESILTQTYQDLDIILVDDESPDRCPQMCDEYAKRDSRIRVIHKKNGGLGFARNSGLDIAIGKYVMFVDSDDYLAETAVETLVRYSIEYDAQFVKGAFRKIDDNKKVLFEKIQEFKVFNENTIEYEMRPRMLGSAPTKSDSIEMSVWATLYDMDIINSKKLRFDSERTIVSEDLPFNLTYLTFCETAILLNNVIYNYRLNPNSLTQKYQPNKFLKVVDFFEEMGVRYPSLIKRENIRFSRLFFVNLKLYIKQELLNKSCTTKEIIGRINGICNNTMTKQRLADYPMNKLPIKHQVFLRLVNGKHSSILYLLAKHGLF